MGFMEDINIVCLGNKSAWKLLTSNKSVDFFEIYASPKYDSLSGLFDSEVKTPNGFPSKNKLFGGLLLISEDLNSIKHSMFWIFLYVSSLAITSWPI